MKKSKFTESQILETLQHAESGVPVAEVCRKRGISVSTFSVSVKIDVAINGFRPMQLVCPSRAC